MKYLLIIMMEPGIWGSLSEKERNGILVAHGRFQREIVEPDELLGPAVLAGPSDDTKTVRVRDGVAEVTDGPCAEATEKFAGCYLVECETLERAIELAAAIPEARYTAVEVRPLMHHAGMEM
jgi:hypothetical protein